VAHIACMGVVRIVYATLIGNAEMTITLGRPRHRWEDNIRLDLRETGWEGMDWINLAQDRDHWQAVLNTVMKLQVSQETGSFLTGCLIITFSRTLLRGVSQ